MFMLFVSVMSEFVESNPALVAMILVLTEYIKRWLKPMPWYQSWFSTVLAFVLGIVLAIPGTGFVGIVWLDFAAHSLGLGLVATGLYKVGSTIVSKIK